MSGLILPPGHSQDKKNENRKTVKRAGTAPVKERDNAEEVDILPTELEQIRQAVLNVQRKFLNKPFTFSSIDAVEDAIKNEFAKIGKYGFKVDIGWDAMSDGKGTAAFLPRVEIVGRNEPEFDHNEMSWEVQHGLLDGVAGKMTPDGKLVDPDIVI